MQLHVVIFLICAHARGACTNPNIPTRGSCLRQACPHVVPRVETSRSVGVYMVTHYDNMQHGKWHMSRICPELAIPQGMYEHPLVGCPTFVLHVRSVAVHMAQK